MRWQDNKAIDYHGVYALVIDRGCLLTLRKKRGPYVGMLDLPGGGIEKDESEVEALERELKEETGLVMTGYHYLGEQLHTVFFEGGLFRHEAKLYRVKTEVFDREDLHATDPEEASEWVWLPIEEAQTKEVLTFITKAGLAYAQAEQLLRRK